jgi:hypothetical protein
MMINSRIQYVLCAKNDIKQNLYDAEKENPISSSNWAVYWGFSPTESDIRTFPRLDPEADLGRLVPLTGLDWNQWHEIPTADLELSTACEWLQKLDAVPGGGTQAQKRWAAVRDLVLLYNKYAEQVGLHEDEAQKKDFQWYGTTGVESGTRKYQLLIDFWVLHKKNGTEAVGFAKTVQCIPQTADVCQFVSIPNAYVRGPYESVLFDKIHAKMGNALLLLQAPPPNSSGHKLLVDMFTAGGFTHGLDFPEQLRNMMYCLWHRGDTLAIIEDGASVIELIDDNINSPEATWMFKAANPATRLPSNLEALCKVTADIFKATPNSSDVARGIMRAKRWEFESPKPTSERRIPVAQELQDMQCKIHQSMLFLGGQPEEAQPAAGAHRSILSDDQIRAQMKAWEALDALLGPK